MSDGKIKTSRVIGRSLAFVQDTIDRTISWGFGKLKSVDKDIDKTENKVLRVTKKIGGFIGEAGSEYYKEYDRLKTSRKSK